jgi:hypothetical protein
MRSTPRLLATRRPPRKLHLLALPPCGDVIEYIETALDRAKSGELRAVAIAGVTRGSGITTCYTFGDADWRLLGFAVHCLDVRAGE